MSETYKKIKAEIIVAMKSRDPFLLRTLRGLDSAIYSKAKDARVAIDEAIVIDVISKGIKQRNESIEYYIKGNRHDLVDVEQAELVIYKSYLPAQLTEDEIIVIVDWAIAEVGATTIKDMGSVNKIVMPKTKGKSDSKHVSEIVKKKLGGS